MIKAEKKINMLDRAIRHKIITLQLKCVILFCCLEFFPCFSFSATYYSRTTGDWDVAATWSTVGCGGAAAASAPGATDDAVICNGNTVTATADFTILHLTVDAGGRFDDGGFRPTLTGNLVVNGTIISSGRIQLTGSGTTIDGLGSFNASDRVEITNNKTISSTADITFSGTGQFSAIGTPTITNNGKVTLDGQLSGGGVWTQGANSTLNVGVSGNNLSITTFNASASGNTVNYYGSSDQNVRCPSAGTYHHLGISGISTKTLTCALTVNGNLTLNSGTLDVSITNFGITLLGNWNNQGATFIEQSGTVEFAGTSDATITNSLVETFNNLTFNKTGGAGVTLNNNVIVSGAGTLTMTSGNITTGSNRLTLGISAASVGTLSRVSGSVVGSFERWCNAASPTTWLFPVGTASSYRPALITFNNLTNGSLSVQFVETVPGNDGLSLVDGGVTIYNTFSEGYWDFTVYNSLASSDYNAELTGTGFTSFTIAAITRVLRRTDNTKPWTAQGTHVAAAGSTAKRNNITTDFPTQHCFGDNTNCTAPSANALTGTSDVCTSQTGAAYSLTTGNGNTKTWSIIPSGAGSFNPAPGAAANSVTVDWGATGQTATVRCVENNGCTVGPNNDFSVSIHSIAPTSITGRTSVPELAAGEPYSVTTRAGYTYTWSLPSGGGSIMSGQGTGNITIDWGTTQGTYIVRVIATSSAPACAAAPAFDLSVRVYDVIFSGASGDWTTAATWDCNCVPLSTDNVVITTHAVTLTGNTTIRNFSINSAGSLNNGANSFEATGDYDVDGTHSGTGAITLSGIGTNIDGTGSITNSGTLTISTGAKTILNTALLTKSTGDFVIDPGLSVTNRGTTTIGGALVGNSATSLWTNGLSSTLNIGGALLATGILSASATGNTVNFNGAGAQTIKTPSGTPAQYHHLTTSGGASKTMGAALDLNGNLLISGTAQLVSSNNNLTVAGNWTNTSANADPFSQGTGKVTFDGSSAQTISASSGPETFYDLEINNTSGGITLAAGTNTNTTNILTLTSGVISTSATDYFIHSNTTAGNLVSTNGFVNGNLRRYIASNVSTYLFPVGNGTATTDRHRAGFINNLLTTTAYLNVSVAEFTQAAPNNDATMNTTQSGTPIQYTAGEVAGQTVIWTITPDAVPGGGSYGVQLYVENTILSALDDDMFCIVKRNPVIPSYTEFLTEDGTTAIPASGAAGRIYSAGGGYAQRTGYTSFSQFTIGKSNGITLPVELFSFNAKCNNQNVTLSWATATEINNDYFTIERCTDEKPFTPIGTVKGAGNSSTIKNYEFKDVEMLPPTAPFYYRLKQTDFDGKFNYSGQIVIENCNKNDELIIFPNPSNGLFTIEAKENNYEIIIMNILGRELCCLEIQNEKYKVDLSDQPVGIYFLQIVSKNGTALKKIIINEHL